MLQGRARCSCLLKFFTSKHVLSELFSIGYPGGNHPSSEFNLLRSVYKTIEFIGINNNQNCFYFFRISQAQN